MRPEVLLLQGPVGPFFSRFAGELETRGFTVRKINFNGGDRLFYRRADGINYRGTLDDWTAFLENYLETHPIRRIYLFGDCRQYHRAARTVANRRRIAVFVFEEGYIRPNFVTLEEQGVNGNSPMLASCLHSSPVEVDYFDEHNIKAHVFEVTALYAIAYYASSMLLAPVFRHYQHHRNLNLCSEAFYWIRSGIRKLQYRRSEQRRIGALEENYCGEYFVCPLQVHCDMQVVVHSNFSCIEHFIKEVMASFAEHANPERALVFKHHPLDRGYTNYRALIARLSHELGIDGRVYYVHDACLPSLLRKALGCVLINSTVGMSALFHGTPVKVLGTAVYDRPELTAQCTLDEFWNNPGTVSMENFRQFRHRLIAQNQINGSFYRCLSKVQSHDGLNWSEPLRSLHTSQQGKQGVSRGNVTGLRLVHSSQRPRGQEGDDSVKAA